MGWSYSNKGQAVGTANPQTLAYTCAAGVKLLVVGLGCRIGARAGGAPTYNAVAMTQAGTTRTQTNVSAELWYMLNPPTGVSYTISVPNTGGINVRINASSYIPDPNYEYLLDQTNGNVGTTANPSVSVTNTADGDVVVDMMCHELNTAETANNRTLLYSNDEGIWNTAAQYYLETTGGAAAAMSHTIGADNWGLCVASFRQVMRMATVIET